MADLLFPVRNNFYLGAFQAAINEASDLTEGLSPGEEDERDCLVYPLLHRHGAVRPRAL